MVVFSDQLEEFLCRGLNGFRWKTSFLDFLEIPSGISFKLLYFLQVSILSGSFPLVLVWYWLSS